MRQAVEAPHLPHGTLQEGSARRAATMSMCSGSAYVDIDWAQLMSALLNLLALAVAGVAVWKSNRNLAEGAPYRPRAGGTSIAERNS